MGRVRDRGPSREGHELHASRAAFRADRVFATTRMIQKRPMIELCFAWMLEKVDTEVLEVPEPGSPRSQATTLRRANGDAGTSPPLPAAALVEQDK